MRESDSSVFFYLEKKIPLGGGKEYLIRTSRGPVSVIVYGEQNKPALITYPDIALNYVSCFQGLFLCPEASSLLLHNFCVYHISPPGHEFGAAAISNDHPVLSVNDLADQILEILNYFGLGRVMCMGALAGAYILTLFAMKYREHVLGLILISPLSGHPSWSEWFGNKVMSHLLHFHGMCHLLKEYLLKRYFSKEVRGEAQVSESGIAQACISLLNEKKSTNVWRYLQAINRRHDLTKRLKKLSCRTLVFVGEHSPFYEEALHMTSKLDKKNCTLVEVQACGSLVTEEQPYAMVVPMENFLKGYGLFRPSLFSRSPRSPLSPSYSCPELLYPQSMGLKLKPIKTKLASK